MKLVTKNNYKFATGMFWQIPDDGKRKINLSKLVKDTKHNMFCNIKRINPTWGFCFKDEMQGEKKVASLGKFIIEASKLSASYANSIICFKFKSVGELDDDGRALDSDLYGYIVLLNGTICPDDGEYVSTFEMVRESIIQKAKKHEIETLYLPFEVALELFGVFEVLSDASHQDELLIKVVQSFGVRQNLHDFIMQELAANKVYLELTTNPSTIDLTILHQLIRELAFEQKLKETKDQNLKYLIQNIFTLAHTSDEIYWHPPGFKNQFNKALIRSVSKQTNHKYKVGILIGLIGIIAYFAYSVIIEKQEIKHQSLVTRPVPKPAAVTPGWLINACLQNSDRFFKDLGIWTFTSLHCNSLGAVLTFNSDSDTTLGRFTDLIGIRDDKAVKLNARVGTYVIAYNINPTITGNDRNHVVTGVYRPGVGRQQTLEQLQQAVIDYGLKISLPQLSAQSNIKTINKFSITAKQSPIFLLNHHVLDNVNLSEISMSLDKSSGFYNWVLQGEF